MNPEYYFIRHGMTAGNKEKRYVGRTDEPLCQEGIEKVRELILPDCDLLISSPMRRCLQTAEILYPGKPIQIYEEFRECDFGVFEMHNYQELSGRPDYQFWIDSGGTAAFPGGESPEEFKNRITKAFQKFLISCRQQRVVFIIHGGTIMSIMEKYAIPSQNYYAWHVPNANGYKVIFDRQMWKFSHVMQIVKKNS